MDAKKDSREEGEKPQDRAAPVEETGEADGEAPRIVEFKIEGPPQRLDMFLNEKLPEYSRAYIQRLIEDGNVTVFPSVREVKRALKLPAGRRVRVLIPPPRQMNLDPVDIPLRIIHEDPFFAVVDKPPNITVHPSPNQSANTLVNALLHHLQDLSSIAGVERPGIVHRLDRETSGVLLVAKCDFAHRSLARQFKERTVHKTYLAVVRGEPRQWEGRVELRLGKSYHHPKRQMARRDGTGREAVTDYRVLEKYRGYALLEVYPHTGRTHQIRVHLQSQQLPVACDKLYGREKRVYLSDLRERSREADEEPLIERQALHAATISLQHPATKEAMVFSSGLHEDMLAFLRALARYRNVGR